MRKVPKLETVTARELLEMPLPKTRYLVENFISLGLCVLAGKPKSGKSWWAMELALCCSSGLTFFGQPVRKGPVLYLCLEDPYARAQNRLFLLTDVASDDFHLVNRAEKIGTGLAQQVSEFLSDYPETVLVIVDTLQAARQGGGKDNLYANDYAELGELKQIADDHHITLLCLHHVNKAPFGEDVFSSVSGTNGITGVADETMVISHKNDAEGTARLSIIGRDISYAEYKIIQRNDMWWDMLEPISAEEIEERQIPAAVIQVCEWLATRGEAWSGSASELLEAARIEDTRVNVLGKLINQHSEYILKRAGFTFSRSRTDSARTIFFDPVEPEEGECDE